MTSIHFQGLSVTVSPEFLGYIQKTGEWPFEVHFFNESQINGYIRYCKKETYSYLHIDATGSIVRKFKNQNQVYFYTMVYTDNNINLILPASGALLSDHTTGSITAYFNNFRGKAASLSKTARPSFVVIDFSPALLNSVLASFNIENVHSHLRRCSNTLDGAYNKSQLKDMTFVRLCCSHVVKAFSRSLHNLESSREARFKIISLFVILLNVNNLHGAYDLYEHIINIYANPHNQNSLTQLNSLLSTDQLTKEEIDQYLDEKTENGEEPHFLDEIDITKDAIIHQSPFNIKARNRMPFLNQIIKKEKLNDQATNQLYAPKIVQLFHKWFAYLPLWSCIMVNFIDEHFEMCHLSIESYLDRSKEIRLFIFSDTKDESSESEASSDDSFHCSNKSSGHKTDQSGTFIVSDTFPLPISSIVPELPIINEDFTETLSPQIILAMSSTDTNTTDISGSLRRSSRKHTPNTKYTTDYISPTISPTASGILSPKRSHSPSITSVASVPQPPTPRPIKRTRKKAKQSPLNSPNKQQIIRKKRVGLANIGPLELAWPRFGIRKAIFEGQMYSVTNTCPLDTGLFVMYYAYTAGSFEFRDLFERDTLEIYSILRRTFQLVESDDWTVARLYWLTTHNLLQDNAEIDVHNIENTLTEIVFRFLQPMQKHTIKSKCSCNACPKQLRYTTNFDLNLV